ncbi:MAG: hypothetical protein K0R84_2181, partial [Clostridia bacterium]|nr:hypothetical protein [Clostridia bacterium]
VFKVIKYIFDAPLSIICYTKINNTKEAVKWTLTEETL